MRGHGRPHMLAAVVAAALGLFCRVAQAQFDAAHPPRAGSSETVRSLAPTTIPEATPRADVRSAELATAPSDEDATAAPYRNDAAIDDLVFVDRQHGWAVGDAGVLWHTADGGQQWQQQASGVACRLQSVQFVDEKNGWAAGSRTAPYTHLSTGVLLRTRDGGEHWTSVDKLLLPALRRIQFFSPTRGCAVGQASAMYSCGVFFTDDGGRQWSPLPTADAADCTSGFLTRIDRGALALADGSLAVADRGRIRAADAPPFGLASVRQLQFADAAVGWLVGDGGLVMTTSDGGRSWRKPLADLPREIQHGYDFSALAVRGSQVWIAGSPGKHVFHSADGGRSWTVGETEQQVPIMALTFVDELHGWCAGALGTIEATDDGGRTWRRQRAGAERVALLGIFSEPQDLPLEVLARESAANGYLSDVELINRRDVETHPANYASLPDRTQEALCSIGVQRAHFAWQFPLRQPGIELPPSATETIWDQAVDGKGSAALDEYLVRQIRIWRPSVVVTAGAGDNSRGATANLLQQAIVQAVGHAADPAFGDRTPPWTVQRLFTVVPTGQPASVTINGSQLAPRLGQSLAEITWEPRGLIFDRYRDAPEAVGFRSLENSLTADAVGGDFFGGLGLRPGGDARRELPEPTLAAITALRHAARQRGNAEAILKRSQQDASSADWLTQVSDLTAAMDSRSAGENLFRLGEDCARAGRWSDATKVFELLVAQYPQQPVAPPAEVWLLQSCASSIAEHQSPTVATDSTQRKVVPGFVPANAISSFTGAYRKTLGVEQPIAVQPENNARLDAVPPLHNAADNIPAGSSEATNRLQHAIQIAGQIERTQPALFAEPSVRFPLAAAYRRLGMMREAEHALAGLRSGPHDVWWSCAEAESWLADGRGPAPKRLWHCPSIAKRPRLDGTLGDPAWQHAEAVELHSGLHDDAVWPAVAKLACDSQFLYLAVRCRQAAGADYRPAQTPRPRQADLSTRDHIDLLLSPDRDYTSYYRLSIDYRGWVSSGCRGGPSVDAPGDVPGDAPWQPVCYVAAGSHGEDWIVEAVIPWNQMVDDLPTGRRRPWAVNIQRTVPGVGFQSWSNPAGVEIRPEGMGLLMFDPAAEAKTQEAKTSGASKISR